MRIFILMTSLIITLLFSGCNVQINSPRKAGIFTVLTGDTILQMDGVINKSSLNNFNQLFLKYPDLKAINIINCDGSSDDNTNLLLSYKVHELEFDIFLEENGLIASGGVDFFLAGKNRTSGYNTLIGVHSWSGLFKEATDFPVGHENHQPYIDYYVSIGFSQQEAEDFYYYTINSASAKSIHWMTNEEIEKYNIITNY